MTSKKIIFMLGLISVYFSSTDVLQCFSNPLDNVSAETLYRNGKYKESEQKFEQEYSENPEDSRIAYNLANSAYKSGNFENALSAYRQSGSLSQDKALQQKSLYNSGNTLFRMGKLEEAEDLYRKALELDSSDMDAKYNLEFVREQIKKKKQEEKKKESQQNKKDDDSSSDSSSPQEADGKKDPQKPKPDPNAENKFKEDRQAANPSEQKHDPKDSDTTRQQGEMTQEEAERRLNALNENRKEFIQKQLAKKHPSASMRQDW